MLDLFKYLFPILNTPYPEFKALVEKFSKDDDIEIALFETQLRITESSSDELNKRVNASRKTLIALKAFNDIVDNPTFIIHQATEEDLLTIEKSWNLIERFQSREYRLEHKVELEIPDSWIRDGITNF